MGEGFLRLVENAALLVALAYVYGIAARRFQRRRTLLVRMATGVALGGVSVGAMVASWSLRPGIVFDTRSVVLSVGTLFFGTVPGVVAAGVAAGWRLGMGGAGAPMGVSVIVMSVTVGALWRWYRGLSARDPGLVELLVFGLLVHVLMLLLTVLLPEPAPVLRAIALPVLTVYPAATVLLGRLLLDERQRVRAEAEMRALNRELEARVRSRTRELELAVADMESLAYSIAHDLRGPLRAIDGFITVIHEECGERLGEPCLGYFSRVRAAARRMATLIDGLLALSRLSRAELQVEDVNLSGLARDILAELSAREPERKVEMVVEPGLHVVGDGGLLRAALANLLENAWKFTRTRDRGRIEVFAVERDGRPVFCVRDNGVGFDPERGERLFRPFERLHGEEFEGTGIGLASVARVIARHHGRVWAEGAPGQGAAFWFTLWDEPRAGAR